MIKNISLAVLLVTIVLTCFILPSSVFVESPRLSIVIPFFISVFAFGSFISEWEEVRDSLIKYDENGKKNDQNFILAIVVSFFVFIGIYAINQHKEEAKEFNKTGIQTEGIITWSEKKITENDAKITVEFTDAKQKKYKGIAEFEISNAEFYKYALGKKVVIKYLPNNPEIIKIIELK